MKYLLIGNGPLSNLESHLKQADFVVQFNDCHHAHLVPPHLTKVVFMLNSGLEVSPVVIERFIQKQPLMKEAEIILTRNIPYCRLKEKILLRRNDPAWEDYSLSDAWKTLLQGNKISNISFLRTLFLDIELMSKGMPFEKQPSSGLIAYKWIKARMKRGDQLQIDGFTFTGWKGHAWSLEKSIVKAIPSL